MTNKTQHAQQSAAIRWTPKNAAGAPVIDEQHRQLSALAGRLHQAMLAGRGKEILGSLLADLAKYTSWHAAHEQELSARLSKAHVWRIRREHENLRSKVQTLQDRFAQGEVTMTIELSLLLAHSMEPGPANRPSLW